MDTRSRARYPTGMWNHVSLAEAKVAIRGLFRARHDRIDNLPLFSGIVHDQIARIGSLLTKRGGGVRLPTGVRLLLSRHATTAVDKYGRPFLAKSIAILQKTLHLARAPILQVPSLWFVAALICLLLLELIPTSGQFLEQFDAFVFVGWLLQLAILSLLIDSLRGVLPRELSLIPIIFYSSYYFALWKQNEHISLESELLVRENPAKIIDFDPDLFSLVTERADEFAASHYIPVAYAPGSINIDGQYISYRFMKTDDISKYLYKNKDGVQIIKVYLGDRLQPNVGVLRLNEQPKHHVLSAEIRNDPGEGWKEWNIGTETTSLILDSRVIGSFKRAFVRRLLAIPFFAVGCKSSAGSSNRNCYAEFMTQQIWIESRPRSVDVALYDSPVSIMLGIRRLSNEEIAGGVSWGSPPRPAPGEDQAFDALRDVVEGRSPALSWSTSVLIASDQTRLAPFATGMAKRFLDLSQSANANRPGRREQAALLATGIAGLGRAEFATVQDLLADLARKDEVREEYPLLYLRLADSGPQLYPIYRDQFLAQNATQAQKLFAVLAICRMGQADGELISALKLEWAESDEPDNYRAALSVALTKLGQENELRAGAQASSKILRGWYDAVLAGRGKTDVGPNNCMPMEWPGDYTYVPPSMAPRLRWVQQQWRLAN